MRVVGKAIIHNFNSYQPRLRRAIFKRIWLTVTIFAFAIQTTPPIRIPHPLSLPSSYGYISSSNLNLSDRELRELSRDLRFHAPRPNSNTGDQKQALRRFRGGCSRGHNSFLTWSSDQLKSLGDVRKATHMEVENTDSDDMFCANTNAGANLAKPLGEETYSPKSPRPLPSSQEGGMVGGGRSSEAGPVGRLKDLKTVDRSSGIREIHISASLLHKLEKSRKIRSKDKFVNQWNDEWEGKVKQTLIYNQTVPFVDNNLMRLVPEWRSSDEMVVSYELRDLTPQAWSRAKFIQHRFQLLKPGKAQITDFTTGKKITVIVCARNDKSKKTTRIRIKMNPNPVLSQLVIHQPNGRRKVHLRAADDDYAYRVKALSNQNVAFRQFFAVLNTIFEFMRWVMVGV